MMQRQITNTVRGGFAVFLLGSAVIMGYHYIYVWPAQKCEAGGDWWDSQDRQCLTPIPIQRFTGRLPKPGDAPPAVPAAVPPPKR